MPHGYPIFLDVSSLSILIVGGGAVASRKASVLLAAGATHLRAVAPKFVRDFPEAVQKLIENFRPEMLEGAALVFAATDSSSVNDAVVAEARRRGIWVNRADGDEEEPGDFVTPAILRCGAITVAVSAAGGAALAAAIRDELAGSVTDAWANLAEVMKKIRPVVKATGLPIAQRREIFRALATRGAADVLAEKGLAGLWTWTREKFAELPESVDH